MKPISGFVELTDPDIIKKRDLELEEGFHGLGPADLIVLTKNAPPTKLITYHYSSGVQFNSLKAFSEYYKVLLARRPHKVMGGFKYEVEQAVFCSWNPFKQCDIRVTIEGDLPPDFVAYKKPKVEIDIDNSAWEELLIANTLRFWMPQDQLFRALFNLPPAKVHPFRVDLPPRLTDGQVLKAARELLPSDDLAYSFAAYLVANYKGNQFLAMLRSIAKYHPRVVEALLSFIPPESPLGAKLISYASEAFYNNPDDIMAALAVVDLSIANNDTSRCAHVVPFLLNNIWASPYASIAIAQMLLRAGSPDDAILYLNAAFYAREFEVQVAEEYNPEIPQYPSGRAPRATPRTLEHEIIESALYGLAERVHNICYEVALVVGAARFKFSLKERFPSQNYEQDKITIKEPNQNKGAGSAYDESLDDLFDPGISCRIEVTPTVRKLPLHPRFANLVGSVVSECQRLERVQKEGIPPDQVSARQNVTLSLITKDAAPLNFALQHFDKRWRQRPIHGLVRYRLETVTKMGQVTDDMLAVSKERETFGEHNSLVVTREIAKGLNDLLASI